MTMLTAYAVFVTILVAYLLVERTGRLNALDSAAKSIESTNKTNRKLMALSKQLDAECERLTRELERSPTGKRA